LVRVTRRVVNDLFASIQTFGAGRARPRRPRLGPLDRSRADTLADRLLARSRAGTDERRGRTTRPGKPDLRLAPDAPRSTVDYAFISTISSAFNPLFRILFTFPSQYFVAIGLAAVFSFGWDQPPALGLQSQTTRLEERPTTTSSRFMMTGGPKRGPQGCHLPWRTVRGHLSLRLPPDAHHRRPVLKLQFKPRARRGSISSLSYARFVRHYWGHPGWFIFLRLLICLNSAGGPAWFEVERRASERPRRLRNFDRTSNRRKLATPRGAGSPRPTLRRRSGTGDEAPKLFRKVDSSRTDPGRDRSRPMFPRRGKGIVDAPGRF